MLSFSDSTQAAAPPEEVWRLLHDPARFPEWWAGVEAVAPGDDRGGRGDVTFYADGYPDFPIPQQLETRSDERTVRISCLVSDLRFEWRLEEASGGTRISVDVGVPAREAHRLTIQRDVVTRSLANLAELASAH